MKNSQLNRARFLKWFKIFLGMGILSAAAIYLFRVNPAASRYFPPCPFYFLTGLYCPGCGSTRATHQLLHGNFLEAFDLNPMMILSIPFVIFLFLFHYGITYKGKQVFPRVTFSSKFYIILTIIILAYWVVRNIPFYPFTVLTP